MKILVEIDAFFYGTSSRTSLTRWRTQRVSRTVSVIFTFYFIPHKDSQIHFSQSWHFHLFQQSPEPPRVVSVSSLSFISWKMSSFWMPSTILTTCAPFQSIECPSDIDSPSIPSYRVSRIYLSPRNEEKTTWRIGSVQIPFKWTTLENRALSEILWWISSLKSSYHILSSTFHWSTSSEYSSSSISVHYCDFQPDNLRSSPNAHVHEESMYQSYQLADTIQR